MSDQQSSSLPSPSPSPTGGSAAPTGASPSGQPTGQASSAPPATPQRPAWATESQWDAASNSLKADAIAEELNGLRAFRAEQDVRRNTLPKAETDYQVKLPNGFQAPQGVTFEFDMNDPALAQARKIALARGVDQETFSDMLGVFAATKISEQTKAAQARETNMQALGAAGPQRVEAVATWLKARAGDDGKVVADFITKFPSAPIVKTMETLIRQFSNQGGADFSQSHRQDQVEEGKIPGYENMNFAQRRVVQMQLQMQRQANQRPAGR